MNEIESVISAIIDELETISEINYIIDQRDNNWVDKFVTAEITRDNLNFTFREYNWTIIIADIKINKLNNLFFIIFTYFVIFNVPSKCAFTIAKSEILILPSLLISAADK